MRILVVTRSTPLHAGAAGMERISWDLIRSLKASGKDVTVLTTVVDGRDMVFTQDGVEVRTIPGTRPGRYSLRWWSGTARYDLANFDMVFSVSAGATSMVWLRREPAYVFQAHGTALAEAEANLRLRTGKWPLRTLRSLYWTAVDNITYRMVDSVIAASEVVADKLCSWPYSGAWRRTRLAVVPNAVYLDDFTSGIPQRSHDGPPVAITVSRLAKQKGVDRVVAALPHALDMRLVVVGGGEERTSLKKLASDLGVANRVTFTGHLDSGEVAAQLKGADIFVYPVRAFSREALALSVLEALAAGLSVVVPQGSTWPDDLAPLLTFADMDEPECLAAAMTAAPAGERRCRLPARYSGEVNTTAYSDVLAETLRSRRG